MKLNSAIGYGLQYSPASVTVIYFYFWFSYKSSVIFGFLFFNTLCTKQSKCIVTVKLVCSYSVLHLQYSKVNLGKKNVFALS